jgi:acetolactate synthase-1/2/3 large subunit
VDQKENVYPMIPSGAAHNEMLLGPEHQPAAGGYTGGSITDEGMVLV